MKAKFAAAVLLTIGVLLAIVGVTSARQSDPGNTVYLPIIRYSCAPKTSAYVSANPPVVRVGEIVTLTGAIVNECAPLVGEPYLATDTTPQGILLSSMPVIGSGTVAVGEYREFTLTLRAVGEGTVTLTPWIAYESINDFVPPGFYWDFAPSYPIVVRVLRHP